MSLGEFIADQSLGESWVDDDDFDLNSLAIPIPSPSPTNNNENRFGYNNNSHHVGNNYDNDINNNRSIISSKNLSPPYIVQFSNLTENATTKLMQELFESRFTSFEKCKVMWDPNPPQPKYINNNNNTSLKRKIAFIHLRNVQDFQKVLKWNDIFIERLKTIVAIGNYDEFIKVKEYNDEIGFDEELEELRIKDLELERRNSKGNNILRRKNIKNQSQELDNTNFRKEKDKDVNLNLNISNQNESKNKENFNEEKSKHNPFGIAKPVNTPDIPLISENSSVIAKVIEKGLENSEPTKIVHKPNPFGSAKPVDTLTKQLEIERKFKKVALNQTTFNTSLLDETNHKIKPSNTVPKSTNKKHHYDNDINFTSHNTSEKPKAHSGGPITLLKRPVINPNEVSNNVISLNEDLDISLKKEDHGSSQIKNKNKTKTQCMPHSQLQSQLQFENQSHSQNQDQNENEDENQDQAKTKGQNQSTHPASFSSRSSSRGYKTRSGYDRRLPRELSEEEYEKEMKKLNSKYVKTISKRNNYVNINSVVDSDNIIDENISSVVESKKAVLNTEVENNKTALDSEVENKTAYIAIESTKNGELSATPAVTLSDIHGGPAVETLKKEENNQLQNDDHVSHFTDHGNFRGRYRGRGRGRGNSGFRGRGRGVRGRGRGNFRGGVYNTFSSHKYVKPGLKPDGRIDESKNMIAE